MCFRLCVSQDFLKESCLNHYLLILIAGHSSLIQHGKVLAWSISSRVHHVFYHLFYVQLLVFMN